MKTFKQHIMESAGVTHAALSKKVAKLYAAHKAGSEDHETVHVKQNVHTGATRYTSGSVKANSLAYRHTPVPTYATPTKYVPHPMGKQVQDLIKKHGGTSTGSKADGDEGGYIDTSDGYRHRFSGLLGSNYNTFDHEVHKKAPLKEETLDEAKSLSLHDDLVKNHGFTHKEYHMQGSRSKDAKGDDHYHTDEEVTPKYVHDILIKHGYTHLTRSKADSRVSLPAHTHYEKEQMGSRHSVTVHSQAGYGNAPKEVTHITTKHYVVRD